jgi:hypothetical protein
MSSGLGRQQRRIIATMGRHDGHWPWAWRIAPYIQQSFEALVRRGLIEPATVRHTEGVAPTYRLTAAGKVVKP